MRSMGLTMCLALVAFQRSFVESASSMGCQEVRYAYSARGINVYDVPLTPQSGVELQICPQGPTCCTRAMETRLGEWSSQQYRKALQRRTDQMAAPFKAKATQLDGFMMELFSDSQRQFHQIFTQTYGVLYERNARLFKEYFYQLKRYFIYGKVSVHEATGTFFSSLYQKMFQVMNSQYRFDAKYMGCVASHMDEAMPFGDVPKKMAQAVKRSLVAVRALSQALKSSFEISEQMKGVPASEECLKSVQKMNSCPACQGFPGLRPCNNYCVNVMKGCLQAQVQSQDSWDKFVDSLMKLSDMLSGPFNVEMIIHPLDISISDAIMTFQESGFKVTQKVFEKCGQPRLVGRPKRSAAAEVELTWDRHDLLVKRSARQDEEEFDFGEESKPTLQASTARKSDFERLIGDLRRVVRSSQGFWRHLPYTMCAKSGGRKDSLFDDDDRSGKLSISEVRVPSGSERQKEKLCWNGRDSVPDEGGDDSDHEEKSEQGLSVKSLDNHQDLPSIVKEQMDELKTMTEQIKLAQRGGDVEWWSEEEDILEAGGSGYYGGHDEETGSGAGGGGGGFYGVSDDEDYFDGGSGDDDDDMRIEEGGSGAGGGFWNEKKPDHDEEDNGPWVDWSPPATKDQDHNKKKKPVVVHDHEKPMDNEIDDTRHRNKVGSGSPSTLVVRLRHKWEVATAVAKVLLPTLVCYMATGLTSEAASFWHHHL